MSPQSVDVLFLFAAAILPIVFIALWRFRGAILGVLTVWGLLALAGPVRSALDPDRDAQMLDTIWLLSGWIGGILYCGPIWATAEAVRRALGRRDGSDATRP